MVTVQPSFDRSNRIEVVAYRHSLFGCAARFVCRHSVGAILGRTPKVNYLIVLPFLALLLLPIADKRAPIRAAQPKPMDATLRLNCLVSIQLFCQVYLLR